MTRLMRQAIRDGDIRGCEDPGLATRLTLGMAVSVVEWYRPDGSIGAADLVDTVERLAFGGLLSCAP